jgi:WXG100 family type VII secretion target
MAGQITVNTEQVAQIASTIEGLNQRLNDSLKNSQNNVNNLKNTWEGQASDATISSFNEFAAKYFQNYYDVIDQYVKFLRKNISEGYSQTETANTSLADAFK